MKRIAQEMAFRLRDLADQLDREDAMVKSRVEHKRIGSPWGVLPTVTFTDEGPAGFVKYVIHSVIRMPVDEAAKP
jgi:hypothetical protein